MNFETAEVSLLGDRGSNQDRAMVVTGDSGWLLAVADGMGGHADGALAAETAVKALVEAFRHCPHPVEDPNGFLETSINAAHDAVYKLGADKPLEQRPRTTVTVALIEEDVAHLGHVGDSRIHHYRGGELIYRTRDHSHVEALHREGMISEDEMLTHPMRHYVESCLGGEVERPDMAISTGHELEEGDLLVLSSDGFWTPLDEEKLGQILSEAEDLQATLEKVSADAVEASHPASDNTTAVVLRCEGD